MGYDGLDLVHVLYHSLCSMSVYMVCYNAFCNLFHFDFSISFYVVNVDAKWNKDVIKKMIFSLLHLYSILHHFISFCVDMLHINTN